jgi:hypothetical protein
MILNLNRKPDFSKKFNNENFTIVILFLNQITIQIDRALMEQHEIKEFVFDRYINNKFKDSFVIKLLK